MEKDFSKFIGEPFEQFKDGYAWGCLAPMYRILPETLSYKYEIKDWENMLTHFKKECQEVSLEDLQYGDIIIVKPPILPYHLLVYVGDGKALHCTRASAMELVPIVKYNDRVKGVFRVWQQRQ